MIATGNVVRVITAFAMLGLLSGFASSNATAAKPVAIKVYKTPQCGCCRSWVDHLRKNGFQVETVDMPDLSMVKAKYGVKPDLQACHTAIVNGYVVEGHVPADVIQKLIREKPAVRGVAVPGMPAGSPGMEGALKQAYEVYSFDKSGKTRVYARR
jgi:hypothetical protein